MTAIRSTFAERSWGWLTAVLAAGFAATLPGVVRAAGLAGAAPSGCDLDPEENAALVRHLQAFGRMRHQATIAVFPVRINGGADFAVAGEVADQLGRAGIGRVCAVAEPLACVAPVADPDERRALWRLAGIMKTQVRTHPGGADYVLGVEAGIAAEPGGFCYLHLVLCDADGGWVIVDRLNSRQAGFPDLRAAAPAKLAAQIVRRLQEYLATVTPPDAALHRRGGSFRIVATWAQPFPP